MTEALLVATGSVAVVRLATAPEPFVYIPWKGRDTV
jgi:hypothetical protein